MGKIIHNFFLNVYYIKPFSILKKKKVVFLLFFVINTVEAQILLGHVIDESKNNVVGAIITINNSTLDTSVDYAITNSEGKFEIKLEKGIYKIEIEALGFQKVVTSLNFSQDLKSNFVLKKKSEYQINEVILTKKIPIKIKSDTVEYNAMSFKDGTERNVEDLLKKLPGVSVDSNGKIKINGKEIEKVMVENDDFFEKGYTLLTKNLSVKPVEKIQILENYSANKLLKGVEKSDKIVINLTLEENAKAEWFGEILLSNSFYPKDFLHNKISLARFARKYKYFFLGDTNTIGNDPVGDIRHLLNPTYNNEAGFINNNSNLYTYDSEFNKTLLIDFEKYKLNNDKIISNNSIFKITDKTKIKIVNLSTFEKINFNNITSTSFNLNDIQFENLEINSSQYKKNLFFNKIETETDISKNNTLKTNMSYSFWNVNNNQQSDLNSILFDNHSFTKNYLLDANVLYTHKIKEKSVFLGGLRYSKRAVSNDFSMNHFFFQDLFDSLDASGTGFRQYSSNDLKFFGILSQFIHRNGRDGIWDISAQLATSNEGFYNTMFQTFDLYDMQLPFPYRNDFKAQNRNFTFKLKYNFRINKINFLTQLEANYLDFKNYNFNDNVWKMSPTFNLNFVPNFKGNLNFSAFLNNQRNPNFNLISNYFNDSPRSIIKGKENELFSENLGASFRYSYGHYTDKFTFNIFASYINYLKYQSNNYQIKPLYTINEIDYLDDRKDIYITAELNYYLRFIKSNLKLNLTKSTSNYEERLNDNELMGITNEYNSLGFSLQSGWRKKINYIFGGNFKFRKLKSIKVNRVFNYQTYFQFNYNLSKETYFQLTNYFYSFGASSNNQYNFLDAKLSHNFDDKIQISVLGNNLTNITSFNEKSVNSYSTYISETILFPRNIMLELVYRFGN